MVSFDLGGIASGLGKLAPGAAQLTYEGLQKNMPVSAARGRG